MCTFFDYKRHIPLCGGHIEVLTTYGIREAIFNPNSGGYRFTDCTNPMENMHCNMHSIRGWRYKDNRQNELFYVQPNHYELEKEGNKIINSILNKNNYMSKGSIMVTLIVAGVGVGILGWAEAESVRVASIQPLAEAIHVANIWMYVGIGGAVMIAIGLALLAAGWGRGSK